MIKLRELVCIIELLNKCPCILKQLYAIREWRQPEAKVRSCTIYLWTFNKLSKNVTFKNVEHRLYSGELQGSTKTYWSTWVGNYISKSLHLTVTNTDIFYARYQLIGIKIYSILSFFNVGSNYHIIVLGALKPRLYRSAFFQ